MVYRVIRVCEDAREAKGTRGERGVCGTQSASKGRNNFAMCARGLKDWGGGGAAFGCDGWAATVRVDGGGNGAMCEGRGGASEAPKSGAAVAKAHRFSQWLMQYFWGEKRPKRPRLEAFLAYPTRPQVLQALHFGALLRGGPRDGKPLCGLCCHGISLNLLSLALSKRAPPPPLARWPLFAASLALTRGRVHAFYSS